MLFKYYYIFFLTFNASVHFPVYRVIQLSVFGVVLCVGVNTLYMLCFKTKRRNFRSLSQPVAADPEKKTSNPIIS